MLSYIRTYHTSRLESIKKHLTNLNRPCSRCQYYITITISFLQELKQMLLIK